MGCASDERSWRSPEEYARAAVLCTAAEWRREMPVLLGADSGAPETGGLFGGVQEVLERCNSGLGRFRSV